MGVLTSLTELNLYHHHHEQQSWNMFMQQLSCLAPLSNTLTCLTLNAGGSRLDNNLTACGLNVLTKLDILSIQNAKIGAQHFTTNHDPVNERVAEAHRQRDQYNFDSLATLPLLTTLDISSCIFKLHIKAYPPHIHVMIPTP
jgi:hypothetical protein